MIVCHYLNKTVIKSKEIFGIIRVEVTVETAAIV